MVYTFDLRLQHLESVLQVIFLGILRLPVAFLDS